MSLKIIPPQQIYYDTDGSPLDGGFLYIGESQQNPETHPVPVFWDGALTQPAAQPIQTINGFPSRQGVIANIFTDAAFSITIRNKRHELVLSSSNGASNGGAFALLVFPDYSSASDAAATLPNDQVVFAPDLNGRGSIYVVKDGALVFEDFSPNMISVPSYEDLRGYTGGASQISITNAGIFGSFNRDDSDTSSPDNGGTVIVDSSGRRWKRVYSGPVEASWFLAYDGVTDDAARIATMIGSGGDFAFSKSDTPIAVKSQTSITLTKNTTIDFRGQTLAFDSGRITFKAPIKKTTTITANLNRYSTLVTVADASGVNAGDIFYINTTIKPSTEWVDTKKDCVRISSVSGNVLTLEEGVYFSYTTADAGLTVTIYRPVNLTLISPDINLLADDSSTSTEVAFIFEGLVNPQLIRPKISGVRPFNRASNIYRNGVWFLACWGGLIDAPEYDAMSYPCGIYWGTRNVVERDVLSRYCHHGHADAGDWSAGYRLRGMSASDCYQALNTHPTFNAVADSFNVVNDTGLSNWRCVGGGIMNGRIQTTADDTQELPQFQNITPSTGHLYINADADFFSDNVDFIAPNRITKAAFAVRYGRSARYSNTTGNCWVGLSGGELGLFICGGGNRFGTDGAPNIPTHLVLSTNKRIDVAYNTQVSVASAATLVVPIGARVVFVTGSTTISAVSTSGMEGQTIQLVFAGSLTVQESSGLILNGSSFSATKDAVLTITCAFGVWYEVSRSTN